MEGNEMTINWDWSHVVFAFLITVIVMTLLRRKKRS